jgi:MFS family permease
MSARLFWAAFLTDASVYLAFAALPFRAIEFGAGPARLGILPTLYALAYMGSATVGGRLSDRVPRLMLARRGCAAFLLGCAFLAMAPELSFLFASLPLLGLGLGFFWSPLQAEIADRAGSGALTRWVGLFNVSWSLGKGVGFVLGGALTEMIGAERTLAVAGVPALVTFALLPFPRKFAARNVAEKSGAGSGERRECESDLCSEPSELFVRLAWVTNAITFGAGSTMNVHAPKLLLARGAGAFEFGVIVGAIFVAQTATFAVLSLHRPSVSRLMLAQGLGAAALFLFLQSGGALARAFACLLLGISLGIAYQSSIHASLDRRAARGKAASLHETILGAGSSSLPLAGGLFARATGNLEAPFLFGILVLALVGAATTALSRRSRR